MSALSHNPTVTCCDWLAGARLVAPGSVDFVYADPPFNTGVVKRGRRGVAASYTDSWPSLDDYLNWLRVRIAATLPLLKQSGVIAIHVDFRSSHRVRVMLDELLGDDRFVNHLVWSYGLGGSSPRRFARKHDDIIVYSVDPDRYYFRAPMVPATSRRLAGRLKKATDVIEIPSLNNMASERTGYPTQKPLALLQMLVDAFCPPGGTVLDPCCGSGTTLIAAARTGRKAIGFDASPAAAALSRNRLGALTPGKVVVRNPNNRASGIARRARRGSPASTVE